MGFENDIADARMGACHSARRWLAGNFALDLRSLDLDSGSICSEYDYEVWLSETAECTITCSAEALICLLACSSGADAAVDSEFGDEARRRGTLMEWAHCAYRHDLADYIDRRRDDKPWEADEEDEDEEDEEDEDND